MFTCSVGHGIECRMQGDSKLWLLISVIQLFAHFHMVNLVSWVNESKVGSPIPPGLTAL